MASNRSKRRRAAHYIDPVIEFGDLAKMPMSEILQQMMSLLGDPSQIRQNPEYQFLRSEGMRGLSQGYGAAGKLLSGQAGRGFIQRSQDTASTFLSQMLARRGGVFSNLMQQYQTGVQARMGMGQFVGTQKGGGGLGGLLQAGATAVGAYFGGPWGAAAGAAIGSQLNPQTSASASGMFTNYGGGPGQGQGRFQDYGMGQGRSFNPFYRQGSGIGGMT